MAWACQTPGGQVPLSHRHPGLPVTALRAARGADWWAVAGLIGLGVILPVTLSAAAGSLSIPHNDDAAYRRIALHLFETGRLQLNGWGSMSLIGQLAFVQPFLWVTGAAAWAFSAATIALAMVAIVAAYALARLLVPPKRAAVALLVTLTFPGFLLNATTFMTDIPAFAAEMVCLLLGSVALGRSGTAHWRWLVASLVAGCFAFSIREFALAAPGAVVLAALASNRQPRIWHVVAGAVVISVAAGMHLFTAGLPGQWSAQVSPSPGAIGRIDQALATVAVAVSPALVVALSTWRRQWRLTDMAVGALVGAYVFGDAVSRLVSEQAWPRMLVGNLLEPNGALGSVVGAGVRPVLLPPPLWDALNAVALIAGLALFAAGVGAVGSTLRSRLVHRTTHLGMIGSPAGVLAIFVALYGTTLVVYGLLFWTFDRYLLPIVLPLAVLLLRRPAASKGAEAEIMRPAISRFGTAFAGVLLLGLAGVSVALLLNGVAYDTARWRMGEVAVARGIPADRVDAGLEWVSNTASGLATPYVVGPNTQMWYVAWWPSVRLCAMVSSSPLDLPGFHLEAADIEAYRLLLFMGPEEPLYLYRVRMSEGCT
jgi:4-amino-4-deoxy-L-arabinose transferase-like glycosyltransferase